MRKAQELVTKPIAVVVLLALLGVTAHASAILVLTSRDAYESLLGPPDFAFNFDNIGNVRSRLINFGPGTITGDDLVVNAGALEFLANPTTRALINFAPGFAVDAWGADITPSGPGQIQFSAGGLSGLINISGPSFIGFASGVPFRAFNINFVALESLSGGVGIAQTPSTNFIIDNLVVNLVPEPATLALFATGAGLLGWARRRRMRASRLERSSDEKHD